MPKLLSSMQKQQQYVQELYNLSTVQDYLANYFKPGGLYDQITEQLAQEED